VVLFSLASATNPSAAAAEFIKKSGATVKSRQSLKVNGLSAHTLTSEITSEESTIPVVSYFIQMDNRVFTFHGFSSQEKFALFLPTLKKPMAGFKRLTDRNKINVKPAHLTIKKITRSLSLKQALKQFGVTDDKLEEMAILNGKKLEDQLPANTLVKIVVK